MELPESDAMFIDTSYNLPSYGTGLISLPMEVLEHIVLILAPQDILSFALTSKLYHSNILPLLYRDLDLVVGVSHLSKRQNSFVSSESSKQRSKAAVKAVTASIRCINFLQTRPELLASVRRLQVSEKRWNTQPNNARESRLPLENGFAEMPAEPPRTHGRQRDMAWNAIHFLINQERIPTRLREFIQQPVSSMYPHTFQATNHTLAILPHLVHLTHLTLRTITLPKDFFTSIQMLAEFGNLRTLTLRHVRVTSRYPRIFDPTALRLTELTLIGIYARLTPLKSILKLARARTLTKLRLDRSLERAFNSLMAFGLPPSVVYLALDFRSNSVNFSHERTVLAPMFKLLNACGAFVEHLELIDIGKADNISQYPVQMRLAKKTFLRLHALTAPPAALSMISPQLGGSLDQLTLTDVAVRDGPQSPPLIKYLTLDDVKTLLKMLQKADVKLKSLKFNLRTFERELIYVLAAQQQQLKELCIAYQFGDINDDFFMSLGTELKLPFLERLHLYRIGDRMTEKDASLFVEHKEYVIIWQRFMHNLREVVLSPDVKWIRNDSIPPPPSSSSSIPSSIHVRSVNNSLERDIPSSFDMMEIRNIRRKTQQVSSHWERYTVTPKALEGVDGLQVVPCPTDSIHQLEAIGRRRQVDFISKAHLSNLSGPAIAGGHQAPAFGLGLGPGPGPGPVHGLGPVHGGHMGAQWHMTAHALQHAQVHFFQQMAAGHAGQIGNEDVLMLDDALNEVPDFLQIPGVAAAAAAGHGGGGGGPVGGGHGGAAGAVGEGGEEEEEEGEGEAMGELMGELTGGLGQMAVWMQ